VASPGLCPVQRARQDAHRRPVCVNAGLHGPGVATRTGAGMLLLHLPARGMGGVSGKPPPTTQAVVARPRPHKTGGVGVALLPPHKTNMLCALIKHALPRSALAAKGGGATHHPPRFAAPHRQVMDVDLVAVFTRRAQDITVSCAMPRGLRLVGRCGFAQDAVMLHTATQYPPQATTP